MGISILLWFQNIREILGPVFDFIAAYASDITAFTAAVIPFLFYWCSDKEEGKDILLALGISMYLNQFLKVTFSIYRPWILDKRIVPSPAGTRFASGYSFPSFHTQVSGTVYGSIAWMLKDSRKPQALLCLIMPVFIGISRMYLGVHTFRDVAAGLLIAAVSMFLINKGDNVVDTHPEYRRYLPWIAAAFSAAGIWYALNRPYPMDYANGELIVDPIDMMKDAMLCIGVFFGMFAGTALEVKYLNFQTDGSKKEKTLRFIIGSIGMAAIALLHKVRILAFVEARLSSFLTGLALGLYAMFLFPLLFTTVRRKMIK